MEFQYLPAARSLVEPVYVLCDHRTQPARALQLRQFSMGGIGRRVQIEHPVLIKAIKLLRVPFKKAMADDRLRRIAIALVVEPVHAPEIRDPALGGYVAISPDILVEDTVWTPEVRHAGFRTTASASERDYVVAIVNHFLKDLNIVHIIASCANRTAHGRNIQLKYSVR